MKLVNKIKCRKFLKLNGVDMEWSFLQCKSCFGFNPFYFSSRSISFKTLSCIKSQTTGNMIKLIPFNIFYSISGLNRHFQGLKSTGVHFLCLYMYENLFGLCCKRCARVIPMPPPTIPHFFPCSIDEVVIYKLILHPVDGNFQSLQDPIVAWKLKVLQSLVISGTLLITSSYFTKKLNKGYN